MNLEDKTAYQQEWYKSWLKGTIVTFLARGLVSENQLRRQIKLALIYISEEEIRELLEEASGKAYKTNEFDLHLQKLLEMFQEELMGTPNQGLKSYHLESFI